MTSSLTIWILKLKYGRAFRVLFRSQIFDFSFRSNWFSIDICVIFTILFALSLKSADPIKPKSCAVELSSASKISKCWRRTRCLLSFCSGALFNIFRIRKKFSRDKKIQEVNSKMVIIERATDLWNPTLGTVSIKKFKIRLEQFRISKIRIL